MTPQQESVIDSLRPRGILAVQLSDGRVAIKENGRYPQAIHEDGRIEDLTLIGHTIDLLRQTDATDSAELVREYRGKGRNKRCR